MLLKQEKELNCRLQSFREHKENIITSDLSRNNLSEATFQTVGRNNKFKQHTDPYSDMNSAGNQSISTQN